MNRPNQVSADDEMRAEYDFSQGVRGKHYEAYRAGTNVVFLEPDVAKVFTDSASVNQVLRLLLRFAKENMPTERRPNTALQPRSRARKARTKPKKRGRATRG